MKTKNLLWSYSLIMFSVIIIASFFTQNKQSWFLDMFFLVLVSIILIFISKFLEFSKFEYSLIFSYFILIIIGTYYGNAYTPAGFFFQDMFNGARNNYDRIVHLLSGVVWYSPLLKVLKKTSKIKKGFWLYAIPFAVLLTISGLYEIIEWIGSIYLIPVEASIYLGWQGDIWDSQKDMFMVLTGSLIPMIILLFRKVKQNGKINTTRRRSKNSLG